MPKKYWLMKTEPGCFSIDDLKKAKVEPWDGVRNYQARNFMRDEMSVGDGVLIYHSNSDPLGVAGMGRVASKAYPDHTAFDKDSRHYDPKSTLENPRWIMVDVEFKTKFKNFVLLADIRKEAKLKELRILQKANRLSITPVDKKHFDLIVKMGS